jgi:thiol:disulfide interchange protein DsbD
VGRAFVLLFGLLFCSAALALSEADLLEPDKAFRFSARAVDAQTVEVRYKIADGYYLYRDKFKFSADPDTVQLGKADFPPGVMHEDKFFGKAVTYRGDLRFRLPVQAQPGVERFALKVQSQGCADLGVCYVPYDQKAEITLASLSSTGGAKGGLLARLGVESPERALDTPQAGKAALVSDESRFVGVLESGKLGWILLFFFGAGIALTFTPCVLPMVPILSGIIVGEGRQATRKRALLLSLAYVLGMSVTYTAIGVAAAFSGQLLSAALQNAWVLSVFALLFVLLALSMFGVYDLSLPSGLHARVLAASHRLPGGHYGGVTLMGALSAAIVSPCIAAPLAGALLYIGQSNDVWLGGTALFSLAWGMGAPLVLVGVSEGMLLPKSGPWMKSVKHLFGVLLLAVAIWIVSPVLPGPVQLLAWSALLIGWATFLRAIDRLPPDAAPAVRLGKAVGFMALLAGAAMLVGALAGASDPLAPLSGLRLGASEGGVAHAAAPRFERVRSLPELEARLADARRPAMLDFYADWCVSCKEMERFTFSDARVRARLADMLVLQADVTANTEDDKALLKRFRLFGPPGTIFFDASGREIEGLRVIGFQNAARFLETLDAVASRANAASGTSGTSPRPLL